ncbi:POP1-domain-containing protein [Epithele typhae]|uniref:POP1-domain-containing protein n=1 Tax=Epithele typhae TaxID=378194 RepID=UPI0020082620|nr:POP1-domain-containing protein [Epithele typhae]KAH9924259.1 POP1-domain-containing protein [Epithele typhae]
MAPKRPSPSEELSGRERKKQKTALARTIAVQPGASSRGSGNAEAGSSKSVRFESMKGLPGAVDVERFAEARAFEINAMHEAMQNARSSSTTRAWQQLPRHLRRRAASHDVRRVPLKLRDKAQAEMDPVKRKSLGRRNPKQGKARKVKRTTDLLRRQKDKAWLETHIWHSKRMHMEEMWGYRLAVTPTEKSFRPSHRASIHGSILHDASYYAVIELRGPEGILRSTLHRCCDCQGPSPGAKRFLAGARTIETSVYAYDKYPYDFIAPVTLLWRAEPSSSKSEQAPSITRGQGKGKGKKKGKEKEILNDDTPLPGFEQRMRTIWIRVHPAVTEEVHKALRTSASFALEAAKQKQGEHIAEVEIADLREHFNMFDLVGPKASQVIKGALKPVEGDQRADFKQFWSTLDQIQTAGSMPRGMVIGFTVHDPRLSFPPANIKLQVQEGTNLSVGSTVFPSGVLAQSQIWNEDTRLALRKPRYQKKDIDSRRAELLVPGTPLKAERNDERIPVLLIQRSIEPSAPSADRDTSRLRLTTTTSIHGWTLVVPQGWGMPFFSSLTHTGTRTGGQRECQTQTFEAGCPHFPRDFPACSAYADHAAAAADEARAFWERRPPAKRPNYAKLGTRSPWRPDWRVVLGLEEPAPEPEPALDNDEVFLDAQREVDATPTPAPAPFSEQAPPPGPNTPRVEEWLLRGPDVPALLATVASMLNPASGLLVHLNQLRDKRGLLPLSARAEDMMRGALVHVGLKLCGRGCPDDMAVIYGVADDEAREWMTAEARRKSGVVGLPEGKDETELSQVAPDRDAVIGYITTGSFSLSLGEGHALGAIPFSRYLALREQAHRLRNGSNLLVKLRNRDETVCRAAYVELLH